MRVILNVEIDTPTGNERIRSGTMEEALKGILGKLGPEAAYFYPRGGSRAMTLVVDLADNAALAGVVEMFWTELGARVEATPCMNADELAEGLGRLG